ncbi:MULTISPECIES: UDP-N-acetylmuramoyl-tripeptide--D-alanyl-D-alanine ligase [Vagococcus]|uniref:UDP-N-acetylmuramoyl-tripeptide--D-alanyl-D- alanine ligase n=1 Tax=Vagococcus TaxID=2737 RepID=UPI000E4E9BED|nr:MULTISPECIES: UDP-N-acetylmuramoyl-tripeptide--D-alanyl-D-alanine ligase [Vagococcus]RHH70248.1 UDP-N-acetylmuramoyl-tripeptide--D-alanyl-D-alanine ligase [Vagococcus sp. AM17-17]
MNLSVREIVAAVNGVNHAIQHEDQCVESVEFDTRKVIENSLFVPLKGARDGHDFIPQAIESGASLVLSERELSEGVSYIKVEDTLVALQKLAQYFLEKVHPKVIGITGSNGKTTTKDMTEAVLSQHYKTYKTQGNYNNHIGLPYTILSMPEDTDMLVLEMGMDHKGEIEVLSNISKPDIAAITLIGESHIEYLGSRAGIAEAKMEITAGLKEDGVLIIPNDEPLLKRMIIDIPQTVDTFGVGTEATLSASILSETKVDTQFETNLFEGEVFSIPVLGGYNVKNALIALLIGHFFNVPVSKMKNGLATFDLTKNRTEWLKTNDGIDILSDVYNANPTAMKLVLDTFSALKLEGRKFIVLGDMLELGELSNQMHESVAEHISPKKIDQVYLYGEQMESLYNLLHERMPQGSIHFYRKTEKKEMMTHLSEKMQPKDTVFLKASNGMGLSEVVEFLLKSHE